MIGQSFTPAFIHLITYPSILETDSSSEIANRVIVYDFILPLQPALGAIFDIGDVCMGEGKTKRGFSYIYLLAAVLGTGLGFVNYLVSCPDILIAAE